MRRYWLALAVLAVVGCTSKAGTAGGRRSADTMGTVGTDSQMMDQNVPGQGMRGAKRGEENPQYDSLGLAPQADTGTAVGEYSVESGGPMSFDSAGAVDTVADTVRLMGAPRRVRNKVPLASFTVGCTGLKCVYRSTSKDPDGSVVKTLWSFPNGDAYTTLQVTRTYNEPGTYRSTLTVVDNLGAKDDTSRTVTVTGAVDSTLLPPPTDTTQPPPPDTTLRKGKPFGPYNLLDAASYAPFNTMVVGTSARYLVSRLDDARTRGYKVVIAIPSPMSHNPKNWRDGCCLRPINGVLQFSKAGFDSAMATYNTAAIKSAMQKAYAEGIIVGIQTMDEPWVSGLGDGNTWGPAGTLTKAKVDELCASHHNLFPGIPVGPSTSHRHWSDGDFKVCDIGLEQFSYRYVKLDGSLAKWVQNAEALANRAGIKTIYSFNPVNGGYPDPNTWDCRDQGGVKGQNAPLCAMTGAQILEVVKATGPYGCGANIFWRYDTQNNAISGIKSGFQSAANYLLGQNYRLCRPRK